LPDILKRLGDKPDPEAVAERLLPDKAEMLVDAARRLYPDEADVESQRPFLLRAVRLLQERTGSQGKDLYLRGRIEAGLGHPTEAIKAYRLALARESSQIMWRLELAKLLIDNGDFKEAEQELERLEREQPNQPEAKDLLETLKRELK
jgi:predicted Zn-dependent protease